MVRNVAFDNCGTGDIYKIAVKGCADGAYGRRFEIRGSTTAIEQDGQSESILLCLSHVGI